MTPTFSADLAAALAAAKLASDFARTEYEAFTPIPDAPVSISTHVDLGCQERIIRHLLGLFPDDGICAEEATADARRPGTTGRVWVVDPIDGTRGFARKTGEFSVMVALTVAGVPTVGVVAEPAQDRVTFATRGGGCFVAAGGGPPEPCRVSRTSELADATLTQSHPTPGRPRDAAELLKPARVLATYSAGVKLALVARGEADLYVNDYRNFHDWDVCAGHILVTEAGGEVTLFDGSPVTYGDPAPQRRGLAATNRLLHAAAVGRLAGMPG